MGEREVRELFKTRFGSEPTVLAVAPGRINLIGEHTDYNEGFVFPVAIDRVSYVAASPVKGQTRLFSAQAQEGEPFDAHSVEPGELVKWAKYPAGMAWALRQNDLQVPNIHAVVSSDIPMGSGVSSSAALEMAFGVIWRKLANLDIPQPELANIGKTCENKFVGVNSGIMDQMASAMGREGEAMFLDTRSLSIEYTPIPNDFSIVLCDTKKERKLTDSAYNERRSQCEKACEILGVPALRDATLEMLESKRTQMDEVVFRRARHVITEDDRSQEFKTALAEGDRRAIGDLMKGSHQSLRYDYEVSCPELDWMAEAAWKAPGCVGARMTGAGFGGACVALVDRDHLDEFTRATLVAYVQAGGKREAEAMPCRASAGARLVGNR
jgi:galactokinase